MFFTTILLTPHLTTARSSHAVGESGVARRTSLDVTEVDVK